MARRIRVGMLTPSCNTVLEPVTSAMVAPLEGVTMHFGRFSVNEISLRDVSVHQFDQPPMLAAARLLADAKVDVIGWNGAAGSWLGYQHEEALIESIRKETGIPATTCLLSLDALLRAHSIERYALVSPYTSEVQNAIIANFGSHGYRCVAEEHLGQTDGYSYGETTPEYIAGMLTRVAAPGPQCTMVLCTNMAAAPVVDQVERATNVPVFDGLCATVWGALNTIGYDTSAIKGWGRLFQTTGK